MKKLIYLLFCVIILNIGCKKESTEEIQAPAVYELKLNQTEATIKAGQSLQIGYSFFKKQEPFQGGFSENLYFRFEILQNTTEDNFFSFNYSTSSKYIYFLAPRKSGFLKIKVIPYINTIPRGEAIILNVQVEDAAISYSALGMKNALLNYQIRTDQNEIAFSNGIIFNQTTSSSRNVPFSISNDSYNYRFAGFTNNNDFILIDNYYGRVSTYNPITQIFNNRSNKISLDQAFVFRDIVIGNRSTGPTNEVYRVYSNSTIDYLGNAFIASVVEKPTGFCIYTNNLMVDYLTDTSKQGVSYTLPTITRYVKKINGVYYLVGINDIYRSSSGKDGWVRIGLIPSMPNGGSAEVCMNSNGFYFYSPLDTTIYKSKSLDNLSLTTINAPMVCSSILPLDNGSIIFNSRLFNLMGVFTPN